MNLTNMAFEFYFNEGWNKFSSTCEKFELKIDQEELKARLASSVVLRDYREHLNFADEIYVKGKSTAWMAYGHTVLGQFLGFDIDAIEKQLNGKQQTQLLNDIRSSLNLMCDAMEYIAN